MSRPWVFVCLLLLIVFSSQVEWKQQYENEFEAGPNTSQIETRMAEREEEPIKEKIILSQEKTIQRLNEQLENLRDQLHQCREEQEVVNGTVTSMTELLTISNG